MTGTVSGPTATKNRVLNVQHDYIDLITDLGLSWHITDEITRRRVVSSVLRFAGEHPRPGCFIK